MSADLALAFDTDWAPDFVIDWTIDRLVEKRAGATWFVTHASPALARLRRHPELFEVGIHPNFAAGSSHGADMASVLDHCFGLVPDARVMRTHQLIQSTGLFFHVMRHTAIAADCSTFLPHAGHAEPVAQWNDGRAIVRFPVIWEDDEEMERPHPEWRLAPMLRQTQGTRIFACHPIHVYLNGATLDAYRGLKSRAPNLNAAEPAQAADLICDGPGPRRMFEDVLDALAGRAPLRLAAAADAMLAGARRPVGATA